MGLTYTAFSVVILVYEVQQYRDGLHIIFPAVMNAVVHVLVYGPEYCVQTLPYSVSERGGCCRFHVPGRAVVFFHAPQWVGFLFF